MRRRRYGWPREAKAEARARRRSAPMLAWFEWDSFAEALTPGDGRCVMAATHD